MEYYVVPAPQTTRTQGPSAFPEVLQVDADTTHWSHEQWPSFHEQWQLKEDPSTPYLSWSATPDGLVDCASSGHLLNDQGAQSHQEASQGTSRRSSTTDSEDLSGPQVKPEDDGWSSFPISGLSDIPSPYFNNTFSTQPRKPRRKSLMSATKKPRVVRSTPLPQPGRTRPLRAAIPEDAVGLQDSLFNKSNYLNILDGTAKGIYADEFAAKTQAKRALHKISEKARRDRLASAIRVMHELLPQVMCKGLPQDESEGVDGGVSVVSNMPITKALVVESAIRYIKQLKAEAEEGARRRGEETIDLSE